MSDKSPKSLFARWSSHPESLVRQRRAFFWMCLIPATVVAACLVFFLTGLSAWKVMLLHPTILFWIVAGTASVTLGLSVCLALLYLMACAGVARKTDDEDRLPFPRALIAISSFFWVVPASLTFLQGHFGIGVFPPQLVFVLNALCLAPLLALLIWIRFANRQNEQVDANGRPRTARRPFLFVLGIFVLGLALLSLLGDVQRWLGSLSTQVPLLSELVMRVVLFSTLLPLSMICFACWTLFRRTLPALKPQGQPSSPSDSEPIRHKSLWQRFLDLFKKKPTEASSNDTEIDETPPAWLEQFCKNLPEGVRMNTATAGKPDRIPALDASVSENSNAPEADDLWLLMGGDESRRPTELQVEVFKRFRDAWEESRLATQKGNVMASDMILSGDEGSGRTEVLLATALYAAMARRQRVLYLVVDSHQAEVLSARLQKRCSSLFLETFLSSGILQPDRARKWIDSLKEKYSDEDEAGVGAARDASEIVPPNILFATPRDVERIFFEGHELFLKGEDITPLRELLRLFEVILVDDFMGYSSMERAHLPFLFHKMRLLLVSCDIRPQFVVSLPRLNENGGELFLASRLYGSADFNKQNAVTLLPRKCDPAWSVPLVVRDGLTPSAVCEDIVRRCLAIDSELRIVVYQKGTPLHKCRELASRLSSGGGTVRVIARLDEIGDDKSADAVLYQTALAGRAGMALRLTIGDAEVVYLSVSSESEALLADEPIFPTIPDETAVALRIHHLRSLLRFVVPGQPVDLSAWERFGVSLSDRHTIKADKAADATIFEIWRQDEWKEPVYGTPLWPYIVLEKSESVKSNAGIKVDFGELPYTDEDIVQLGDNPLLGLGRPHAQVGEETVAVCTGVSSVAHWVEKGRIQGSIDFAHVERLLLGRTEHGENVSADADAAVSAFTVDTFHDGDASCCCQMEIRPWTGDGMDFDTPVRALSWNIECVSEPAAPVVASGRTLGFFDLPSCRDIPRAVSGTLLGLINRYGQEMPLSPPRGYSYPACFSGILLAPRKMDPRAMAAQIQRGVVGDWNTEKTDFSLVLTHLLSGVMRRLVPDFPFYAALPVFHLRDGATAVAGAVAWLVQPINSGRVVDRLVKDILMGMNGQRKLVDALREAYDLMEAQSGNTARLRWLRSFSCSAYYLDETRIGELGEDVRMAGETLSAIERRFAGEIAEIEGLVDPVTPIDADCAWMEEHREFASTTLAADGMWTKVATLPSPPKLDTSGISFSWNYGRYDFRMEAGFADEASHDAYDGLVNVHFRARTCGDCYVEYGTNDPYRDFIGEVYAKLREFFDAKFPDGGPTQLAEFLLAFVQGGVAYVKDPLNVSTDWPRYPSETLMLGGGDCEDSSILYAELLRRAGIENAVLSVPRHAAVGVNVPLAWTANRNKPIQYVWLGKTYVYAETACDRFVRPLGEETDLIPSAEAIKADVIPTPMTGRFNNGVKILNVTLNDGYLKVTVVATESISAVALVVYGRPKKFVYEKPDNGSYPCLGGAMLPALNSLDVWEATLRLSSTDMPTMRYWLDVFVCDAANGTVRGHFVGVAQLHKCS